MNRTFNASVDGEIEDEIKEINAKMNLEKEENLKLEKQEEKDFSKLYNPLDFEIGKEIDLSFVKVREIKHRISGKKNIDIRYFYKDKATKKGVRIPFDLWMFIVKKFKE